MADFLADLHSIFKAYDIRGKLDGEITPELATRIGRAFADFLPERGPVVVGHDMRPSSPELAAAVMDGLRQQGRDCWDVGMVSSDMVYFAPGKFPELAGGIVVTASHNPSQYNGFKFCRESALPVGLDSGLGVIRDNVLANSFKPAAAANGSVVKKDIMETWIQHVLTFVDPQRIKPFRIGIDAGNGMVGYTFPYLQKHLPIEVFPLYFEPDGNFPNHEANPMKTETLKDLSELVVREKLDFGIAFDGDGDRVAFMDEHGEPLSGSMLIALLSEYALERSPGGTVIHDVRTSRSVTELIEKLGGSLVRSPVGNTIIKALGREHDAVLGAETTGHLMLRDNYFVDSAMVAAAVLIELLSEADFTLAEYVQRIDTYKHLPEINFHVEDKQAALANIVDSFKRDGAEFEPDYLDGLTVDLADRWINVRPSNTEPVLRLNAEAKTDDDVQYLIHLVEQAVNKAGGERIYNE